jgi:hypothetical protein
MNVRGARRGPGTWLAIQASTKASTSGELRMRAHSDAVSMRCRSDTRMGERLIAAMRTRKRALDERCLAIDALRSRRRQFERVVQIRSLQPTPLAAAGSPIVVARDLLPVRWNVCESLAASSQHTPRGHGGGRAKLRLSVVRGGKSHGISASATSGRIALPRRRSKILLALRISG